MIEQRTQFRVGDCLSDDFDDAVVVSPDAVLALARAHCRTIPPGFCLGVATRESSKNGRLCANMVCTDFDAHGHPRPEQTYGLLQIRLDEAHQVDVACMDLCDPETNVRIGVALFEQLATRILEAAKLHVITPDVLRYVCWAWNAGIGEVLRSIRLFDLDWRELINRPDNRSSPYIRGRLAPYANAVAEYAARYPLEPATAAG